MKCMLLELLLLILYSYISLIYLIHLYIVGLYKILAGGPIVLSLLRSYYLYERKPLQKKSISPITSYIIYDSLTQTWEFGSTLILYMHAISKTSAKTVTFIMWNQLRKFNMASVGYVNDKYKSTWSEIAMVNNWCICNIVPLKNSVECFIVLIHCSNSIEQGRSRKLVLIKILEL